MVSHNEHNHGHAFHAHHARNLNLIQRDDAMDDNKYNFIHAAGLQQDSNNDASNPDVITVVKHVTVTEPKTFPGPAVYVTKTDITMTVTAPANGGVTNSYESAKSVIQQPHWRPSQTATAKGVPLSGDPSMSGGAKAGVAIAVLLILGLCAGLGFFCMRRKKKQAAGDRFDEKHTSQNSFFSGTAAAVGAPAGDKRDSVKSFTSTHTAATAPRLSLRPVTQFLPSILENRKSTGNGNLNVPAMSEKPRSASPQNPFGDGSRSVSPGHSATPSWGSDNSGNQAAGAVPAAGAPGSTARGPNNVHRVQLEFKPSMDDELELKSGQLVRMLHEYDDGWALCIRMDRSQQGVCPRTCLSKLPIKPRPQGQPAQGRPSGSPNRGPPQASAMTPRPLTPSGRERSNTAGGYGGSPNSQEHSRHRSQSVPAHEDRPVSPIDSSARKPLGQAM